VDKKRDFGKVVSKKEREKERKREREKERKRKRENSNQLNNLSSIFIRIVGFPQTQPPR